MELDLQQLTVVPLKHAVVAIVEDGDELLFIERAAIDTYPGYWSTVTGAIEPGESQREALVREVHEEVGLVVEPVAKVWESITRSHFFILHWWRCRLNGPREVVGDPAEVADHRWVKIEQAGELGLMFTDSRYFFRKLYRDLRQTTGERA
ncbi:MAG: NUDIX hydrolase [Nitrospira sp.]|nr:NUDIX hydrolase [Nitrospira sp.]